MNYIFVSKIHRVQGHILEVNNQLYLKYNIMIRDLATVITSMLSAIPWLGGDFVQFIWGGFSVNNATLNRFFSLHFVLPFVLTAIAIMHLIALHTHGSGNPLGVGANTDRLPMHPYYIFKDLVTILGALLGIAVLVLYAPNMLGHSDNYIPANPMQTPSSIVPEWYLLPFYTILRSIPNKLIGVIGMLGAILILLAMPVLDTGRVRGSQFRPLMRVAFWVLVADFFLLMHLGAQHAEEPYVTLGAGATILYFSWFIIVIPFIGILENSLSDVAAGTEQTQTKLITASVNNGKTGSYLIYLYYFSLL